jgi:hypothetical protein
MTRCGKTGDDVLRRESARIAMTSRPSAWYVAFDWATPFAVLRPKDFVQLAEWLARRWTDFGGRAPIIVEVTASVADAMRQFYGHPAFFGRHDFGTHPDDVWERFRVVVWDDAPPTLAYGDAPPAAYVVIAIRRDGWGVQEALLDHAAASGVVRPAERPRTRLELWGIP